MHAAASHAESNRSCTTGLVAVVVRLLWPKMRRRSGRLGGRGTPGSARAAILNFFAALEPAELHPLLALFLQPISSAFTPPEPAPRDRPAAAGTDRRCIDSPCIKDTSQEVLPPQIADLQHHIRYFPF